MKDPFDNHRITDVPDPLAGISDWPLQPRREVALVDSPTRSRVAAARATALGAALLYEVAWVVVMSKREDLHTMPRMLLVTELAIPFAAALLALAAAAPGAHGMGQPKGRMTILALLSPAFFVVATILASPHDVDPSPFVAHGFQCFAWTALYSVGPLVLAAWALRRSFVRGTRLAKRRDWHGVRRVRCGDHEPGLLRGQRGPRARGAWRHDARRCGRRSSSGPATRGSLKASAGTAKKTSSPGS